MFPKLDRSDRNFYFFYQEERHSQNVCTYVLVDCDTSTTLYTLHKLDIIPFKILTVGSRYSYLRNKAPNRTNQNNQYPLCPRNLVRLSSNDRLHSKNVVFRASHCGASPSSRHWRGVFLSTCTQSVSSKQSLRSAREPAQADLSTSSCGSRSKRYPSSDILWE